MRLSRKSAAKSVGKTAASIIALAAITLAAPAYAQTGSSQNSEATPTAEDAKKFVAETEKKMFDYSVDASRVYWINSTYITDDTDALAAKAGAEGTTMAVQAAIDAAKYKDVQGLDPVTKRKLDKLRGGIVLPAPTTEGAATELNTIATKLNSAYGKGKGTLNGKEINGSDIEAAMGTNRNPEELSEMWESWHTNVGAPMKDDYARMVEIANEGAVELGFADVGAMWRSGYDMPADEFAELTDKLWAQVKPLYDEVHCYTRGKLNEKYGDEVQATTGPIRADLLGNMWAQEWG
ncbi:MAG: M2 family metallopeptidase, partial [Parasphingorhabdus sp.]